MYHNIEFGMAAGNTEEIYSWHTNKYCKMSDERNEIKNEKKK